MNSRKPHFFKMIMTITKIIPQTIAVMIMAMRMLKILMIIAIVTTNQMRQKNLVPNVKITKIARS